MCIYVYIIHLTAVYRHLINIQLYVYIYYIINIPD